MALQKRKLKHPTVFSMGYWLHLPPNYDEKKYYPLILFLHGSAERGNDLDLVKKNGLPVYLDEHPDFAAIVIAPQCPAGSYWGHQMYPLMALLADIEYDYAVDVNRIYVMGLSMGGLGTWDVLMAMPNYFAAAMTVCAPAFVVAPVLASTMGTVPIRMFHGADDDVVPVTAAQSMHQALVAAGNTDVELTVYAGVGHDAWVNAFADEEVYVWLLKQRRG